MIFDSSELEDKIFLGGKYKGKTLTQVYVRDPNYVYWAMEQAPKLIKSKPVHKSKPKVVVTEESEEFETSDNTYNKWSKMIIKPNHDFDKEVSPKIEEKKDDTPLNNFSAFM